MKDKKNLLIAVLLIAVVAMSVGYAALSTTLTVNGTANIDAEWKVLFTDVTPSKPEGSTAIDDVNTPTLSATNVTFSTSLKKPGDEETYTITIENQGTLDAVLDSFSWSTTGSLVDGDSGTPTYAKYQIVSGPSEGSTLAAGASTTLVVRVYWDSMADIPVGTTTIEETLVLTGSYIYVQA